MSSDPMPAASSAQLVDVPSAAELEGTEWFRLRPAEVVERLDVDPLVGLSTAQVASREAAFGLNELAEVPRRPAILRFLDQFKDLMVYILIGAAVVSAAVGDYKDPIVIGIVLLINAVMGFVQENKADNTLAALKGMLDTIVRVRRDGEVQEVSATHLVPGDIVLLEAGDKVPADGRFLVTASLSVDESMLTGESVPADKQDEVITAEVPLAERSNFGFMNTTLVRGRAELVVTGTGMLTEVGKLAGLLGAAEEKPTPLQEQIEQLGKRLAAIAFVAVLAVFGVALINGDTVSEALLNSVALAVAAIPEGLPAVVTVTLAIGVGRLAKRHAIMKRLASVETLGSTTVICSDKTGTLTLNQMTATTFVTAGRRYEVDGLGYGTEGSITLDGSPLDAAQIEALRPALLAGVLCNDAHLRDVDGQTKLVGDPTEGALVVLGAKGSLDPEALRAGLQRVDEVPFDSTAKFMATLHPHPDNDRASLLVVKGAPDVVLARCSSVAGPHGREPVDAARRAAAAGDQRRAGLRGAPGPGPRRARGPGAGFGVRGRPVRRGRRPRARDARGHPRSGAARGHRRDHRVPHRRDRREDDHR